MMHCLSLSAHNWMRPEPLETTLARLRRLGYRSIELCGEPDQYPIEETKILLQKYRIQCWGTATMMFGDRDLLSPDKAQRARTIEYSKQVVQMSADLGGTICCVVPGPVGKIVPTSTPENEWRWAIEGLQEICSYAADRGIRVALEPQNRFATSFLNRVDQTLALCKEVGFDCGIAYDTFHASIEEKDVCEALRQCGKNLFDFHVSENNRLAPGDGHLDWPRIISVLKEIGYRGDMAVECLPRVDRAPPPTPVEDNEQKSSKMSLKAGSLPPLEEHVSGSVSEEEFSLLFEKAANVLLPLI